SAAGTLLGSCSRQTQAMTPDRLRQQYGITDAYSGQIATPDGTLNGTVVPVTLPDGRAAQLIIPAQQRGEPHPVYLSDNEGLHPLRLEGRPARADLVSSPRVVARQTEPAHARKRSWEKEALIIGGGAGAGAWVGGLAGGKKGGGVGAAAGGGGGLIFDLATRNK